MPYDAVDLSNDMLDGVQQVAASPKALTGQRLRGLAFALLGKREYSQADLRAKLLTFGAVADELDALLTELADANYQSDQRVAEMTVRDNLRKGRGPMRIRQALQQRQLPQQLVQEDIAEIDWLAQAASLRSRKFGTALPVNAADKARQYRFLLYRGYDAAVCRQALQQLPD